MRLLWLQGRPKHHKVTSAAFTVSESLTIRERTSPNPVLVLVQNSTTADVARDNLGLVIQQCTNGKSGLFLQVRESCRKGSLSAQSALNRKLRTSVSP